jgi:3',5'-cyclic AMP phosphodiesterase CpdA
MLDPISRRTFVQALGIGACSLPLFPRQLQAAAAALEEISFVVISDTHLGHRDAEEAARQWAKTADEIAKAPGDLVLHLGDVVDGAREAQYPVYLGIRKRIGKTVHEIPGNHDEPAAFEKHIRRSIDAAVEHKWLRFLLLNNSRRGEHDGFLADGQIDWIADQLAQAERKRQYVMLCMHVPAHDNKHPDRGWHVKPEHGQTRLYDLLKDRGQRVLALLHGHFHNGLRGWDDRKHVHEIVFPSALYNQDRELTKQKAPGYNLAEFRPGYTQASIKEGSLALRYRPIGADRAAETVCDLTQLKK